MQKNIFERNYINYSSKTFTKTAKLKIAHEKKTFETEKWNKRKMKIIKVNIFR